MFFLCPSPVSPLWVLNHVHQAGPGGAQPSKKSYDVGEGDFFWTENGAKEFPAVAEEVEVQLGKYKRAVEEINRRAEAGDDPTVDLNEELEANTKHLMSAVATLPQLTERKRTLDKHTNIATALLGHIKVGTTQRRRTFPCCLPSHPTHTHTHTHTCCAVLCCSPLTANPCPPLS